MGDHEIVRLVGVIYDFLCHSDMPPINGNHECCAAAVVSHIEQALVLCELAMGKSVPVALEQKFDHPCVSSLAGPHQRGVALAIDAIDIGFAVEQNRNDILRPHRCVNTTTHSGVGLSDRGKESRIEYAVRVGCR